MTDSNNPREEPSAGKPHARIREGEAEWLSYSTNASARPTCVSLRILRDLVCDRAKTTRQPRSSSGFSAVLGSVPAAVIAPRRASEAERER